MSRRWSAKLKLPTPPTAKHSVGDTQATLLRSLGWVWFTSTGTWGFQRTPFQLRLKIWVRALWPARPPTAIQAVLLVHDTPARNEAGSASAALAGVPAANPVISASAASTGPAAAAAAC